MTAEPFKPGWSDDQLPAAIAAATSWRGVMRELGLNPSSGGSTRTIRRRAALLGLDSSHFRANRSWSDSVLRQAITQSRTWDEVLTALGLSSGGGGARTLVKAHAFRLGLDVTQLGRPAPRGGEPLVLRPDNAHLRQAAESLAAAWFRLCGCSIAFPLASDSCDLLVQEADGWKRVQVKTTIGRNEHGWTVSIARRPYAKGNNGPLVPYDPEDIDYFFIMDGDLTMYVIPSRTVGGYRTLLLRSYARYKVGSASGFIGSREPAA